MIYLTISDVVFWYISKNYYLCIKDKHGYILMWFNR